jgi:aspartate 1-decarboxylase
MLITVLKSKLHRASVTHANINYVGSCAIDKELMEAANIVEYEQIHILNINTGARFITYAIASDEPGTISVNGAGARLVAIGDVLIICAYGQITAGEMGHPQQVFLNYKNKILSEEDKFKPNTITAIGFMGSMTCYVNKDVQEAAEEYSRDTDGYMTVEDAVASSKEILYNDRFEAYDVSEFNE